MVGVFFRLFFFMLIISRKRLNEKNRQKDKERDSVMGERMTKNILVNFSCIILPTMSTKCVLNRICEQVC